MIQAGAKGLLRPASWVQVRLVKSLLGTSLLRHNMIMDSKENNSHKKFVEELSNELQYFEIKEDIQRKNMRLMLYPLLAIFALLAGYGFYLIQSLATDVGKMSTSVLMMSESISKNLESMSSTTKDISKNITAMTLDVHSMGQSTQEISSTMSNITQTVATLQSPMNDISASMNKMQFDVSGMNKNISKPLSMLNRFIP